MIIDRFPSRVAYNIIRGNNLSFRQGISLLHHLYFSVFFPFFFLSFFFFNQHCDHGDSSEGLFSQSKVWCSTLKSCAKMKMLKMYQVLLYLHLNTLSLVKYVLYKHLYIYYQGGRGRRRRRNKMRNSDM